MDYKTLQGVPRGENPARKEDGEGSNAKHECINQRYVNKKTPLPQPVA